MPLSVKTNSLIASVFLSVFSALFLFSCATTKREPLPSAPPAEEAPAPAPGPEEPVFTRIAFGEKLESLLREKQYTEAIALFDTVPEPDASDLSIRMLKLSVLVSAGKTDEAFALANELEAAFPENTDILYAQAVLADARNDKSGRTKYLNQIIRLQPSNSQALTGLGLDALAHKDYTHAKGFLVKAIAANPNNTDALLGLARVYYMQSELDKAANALNVAIAKNPDYSVLWAERARVKSEQNDLSGAIDDIQTAVKLDPDVYGHWIDYGNYLISAAQKEESRAAFTEAIRIEPEYYLAYIYRAGLNDDLGDVDAAIGDYRKVCTLLPEYFYAAESLGILLWGKGDYAASGAAFRQALSRNPKNTSYALMTTLCLYRDNKPDEAKKFMAKYLPILDRSTTEYFLCRLFVDMSGDADVLTRIMKEKNATDRNRMLFYSAMYYDLFQSKVVAQKFYLEVTSAKFPGFFEYRLSQWALRDLENAVDTTADKKTRG